MYPNYVKSSYLVPTRHSAAAKLTETSISTSAASESQEKYYLLYLHTMKYYGHPRNR